MLTARLKCPRCSKVMGQGANERSVLEHMNGSKCREPRTEPVVSQSQTRTVPSNPAPPPISILGTSQAPFPGSIPCPGIPLRWPGLPFWKTYPFQIHDPDSTARPAYDLISVEPPQIRSRRCTGPVITPQDVDVIKECAERNYQKIGSEEALNNIQLREKLEVAKARENNLKLKNLNLSNSLKSAREHLSECKDVFDFVGHNSIRIPALHRIFFNSSKKGWGTKTLLQKLRLAVDGDYNAKNYSQYEINLTILIHELAGAGAVYAMNHSIFALPSLNTIQPYRRQNNLVPCVDGVRFTDISENIAALFGPHKVRNGTKAGAIVEKAPLFCGHTLSFDEIASERKIDYMTATDNMGGLCLEHIAALSSVKVGKNTETVEAAVTAVREGKVHVASEISVGAISRLSETGYGAKPVFMGPSCKKGGWRECLRAMEIVLEAWRRSPHGEKKNGPVLSVTSDGCGRRRAAMFMMTMHSEILPGNPLYPFICNLPGLNRRVGKDNLTADFDWKHLDKRWCTLVCSAVGIVVKNICVNRDLLLVWLERLPDHDWTETSMHALLDPSDAQDVPRAIKLLLCIVEIGELDPEDFDPSEMAEFEAFCILAELFDALLQPFINTTLSLSEQIESLVKFSHLLCALYLQNGTSFMSNQLYGDLQAMVKNAILMVPKTRLINGQLKVFICLLGDDVLEALFGRSRMIGGHSPNSSVGELQARFNSAMNLDYIYEQHPELERKPRRLSLFRMRHVDHLRPQHFEADLRAESCDLEACWTPAVRSVEDLLQKFGIPMPVPFAELFKKKDTDLMRPFGGKYPAISADVDRSMAHLSSNQDEEISGIDPETIDPANPHAIDFDTMIAREVAQRVAESSAGPHSVFAEIDAEGHLAHKKTILRTFFDMTHDTQGSHDRLQRVRGFTIGGKSWTREDTPLGEKVSPSTHFQLGNLFATLICYDGTHLGLAIAKCTLIKRGPLGSKSASVSAVPRSELHLPASPFTIAGQVFDLIPISPGSGLSKWVWNGKFISFSLIKKKGAGKEEISRLRNLQFSVSSCLIDPLHEKAQETLASDIEVRCERENTWVFSDADLLASWYRLWNRLLGDKTLHDKFPKFTGISEGAFPYQAPSSAAFKGIVYSSPIAGTVIEESNINRHTCRVCQKPVKDTDRQTHVGQHILKALCGVSDMSVKFPVSNAYPCGMCGGPTNDGACKVQIKGGKAQSECPSAYPFMISAASKFRDSRPCTNVPIVCPLNCNETHWKYNYQKHLEERHPSWEQIVSPAFVSQIQIIRAEQIALQIPAANLLFWPQSLDVVPVPDVQLTPTRKNSKGQKRSSAWMQNSPSRQAQENRTPKFAARGVFRPPYSLRSTCGNIRQYAVAARSKRSPPKKRPVSTLDPSRIIRADHLDLSQRGEVAIQLACSLRSGRLVYTYATPGGPTRRIGFPHGTRGFLYYHHSDPPAGPLEGCLRFRITSDNSPASFAHGQDFLGRSGLPWKILLAKLFRRASAIRPRTTLFRLDSTFLLKFSSKLVLTLVADVVHTLGLQSLCTEHGPDGTFFPWTGSAVARLKRSTLPEHARRRVLHVRIVKIVQPVDCAVPGYTGRLVRPEEGQLFTVRTRGGPPKPWSYNIDRRKTMGAAGLRFLWENS
ncbi:hypothetical protein DFH09DRAFT_1098400 [Mycena vulgaris]|nr:hypothetical protein DFH09DRAFT_1098400 [Mycena vulgaris]